MTWRRWRIEMSQISGEMPQTSGEMPQTSVEVPQTSVEVPQTSVEAPAQMSGDVPQTSGKVSKKPKGKPRAKHKCPFPSCESSVIHLPRHMVDSHGWSKKDASTVLNRFALRKERVKPSKIKRYVKSIQCPFPRCHSVVKRIYNHLNDVHQLKPGTERYQEILSFVPSNDVSIISSESLTFDNSSSSSESLDESV